MMREWVGEALRHARRLLTRKALSGLPAISPTRGENRWAHPLSQLTGASELRAGATSLLPPCGGDARQGREGLRPQNDLTL